MSDPLTLESVKAELQAWRQQRSSMRCKIPDTLREKILSLRPHVKISRLTAELGINSTMLLSFVKTELVNILI